MAINNAQQREVQLVFQLIASEAMTSTPTFPRLGQHMA